MPAPLDGRAYVNWRKPVRSMNNGNCAEVASGGNGIAIRDSKDSHGLILQYSTDSWRAFVRAARAGTLNVLP
jgi:hypothetical protein